MARHLPDSGAVNVVRKLYGTDNLGYGAVYYPFVRTTQTHCVDERIDVSKVSVAIDAAAGVDLAMLRSANSEAYNAAKLALQQNHVDLPVRDAIAGICAAVDAGRGVWKAPTNASLVGVLQPLVKVHNAQQDELDVDAGTRKSIDAIRTFAGRVTLVWGASTLASNDDEWRHVSVRRSFSTVEESVKTSTHWAVSRPTMPTPRRSLTDASCAAAWTG